MKAPMVGFLVCIACVLINLVIAGHNIAARNYVMGGVGVTIAVAGVTLALFWFQRL